MPYSALSELPKGTSKLPKHAKEIYRAAFNNAYEEYGEESTAHAVAWAAVKKKYRKNESDKWVAKKASVHKRTSSGETRLKVILAYLQEK